MASRHHSLDMSEIADVTDMLRGFEEHNSCRIMMRITTVSVGVNPSIAIAAEAWSGEYASPEARLLASVSVLCLAMNLKAWNSALTHVMYALDFQLALAELGHAAPNKA